MNYRRDDDQAMAMIPVGQVIGQLNPVESCREVIYRLLEEYVDALEHINELVPSD